MLPRTQYAKRDGVHVAYQVVGGGDLDLVFIPSWFNHVEARWDIPSYAAFLDCLARYTRLISFDKHGIGLSDPLPPGSFPPLEAWMDDVRAMMDAAGTERAAIMGTTDGAFLAALFAATYPERTTALVLVNATARVTATPDYPFGVTRRQLEELIGLTEATWGTGELMSVLNPGMRCDAAALEAWGRLFRLSASPATAAAVLRALAEVDIRDVLPTIQVQTLVLHYDGVRIVPLENGRFVSQQIPDAKLVVLPGNHYAVPVENVDDLLAEVHEFLTGCRKHDVHDHFLATVLFTDIVGSTRRAAELGDHRWSDLLEAHDGVARRQVERFQGTFVDTTGDGLVATFDGPARAIRCASAIRDSLRALGIDIRSGLHTGELQRRNGDVAGVCVHIAARVQDLAEPGEVLVSRTIKDLVVGSGIVFDDRGTHRLQGVPDEWQIFAAAI